MVQKDPTFSNCSNMAQNGLKLSKCKKKSLKWSKIFQILSEMVQYGPNSSKINSQNECSWCDSS